MYVLVLVQDGYVAKISANEAYVKVNDHPSTPYRPNEVDGGSGDNNIVPDFHWIGTQGYEESFTIEPGNYWIIIHLQIYEKDHQSGEGETAGTL
jgi:hypothetical protein